MKKKRKSGTNHLVIKLSLLVLFISLAADMLTFTSTIIIGMLTDGSSDIITVVSSVISSIVIGALLAFLAGNVVLRPLHELIQAAKRVREGDFSARVETGWNEKLTVREISSLIKVFNDMTGELENTEMFRKDFISDFSHEFKTPLVSIRGFARQLHDGGLTPEQQREFSRIILDETEYLSALSSNTLLLTDLENKDIVSEKTRFSLDEQLRECMLRLEPQWSEKNINIDMELDEVSFYWNEQLLAHVWNNLFDNAVKFTPEGGSISVSCRSSAGVITIRVRDTGCGIPQDALLHIFEKFYQADSSHTTKGNGLGLPLAKRIVTMCGGRIAVQSTAGEGTEFTVVLYEDSGLLPQKAV